MKFATKISMLSAGLVGAIVLLCMAAIWQSRISQTDNELSYESETLVTSYLADANSSLWALRWGVAQYIGLTDPEQRKKLVEEDKQQYAEVDRHLLALANLPISDSIRAALANVNNNYSKYASARIRWFELMEEGKTEDAGTMRSQILTPAGATTVAAIHKLIELVNNEAQYSADARNAALSRMSWRLLLTGGLMVFMAIVASVGVVNSTVRQLGGDPDYAASVVLQSWWNLFYPRRSNLSLKSYMEVESADCA